MTQEDNNKIEPEDDEGSVEYKVQLLDDRQEKVSHIVSQMRYRVDEGRGEATYLLGVSDDGTLEGLTDDDYMKTREILQTAVQINNYTMTLLSHKSVEKGKKVYEYLVRQNYPGKYIEIKVGIAGSVDSGKCLHPDTPVKLFTGKNIMAKNVKIGSELMGDNMDKRTVTHVYTGVRQMYMVRQSHGMTYIVTENHVLSLHFNLKRKENIVDPVDRTVKYRCARHTGNGDIEVLTFNDPFLANKFLLLPHHPVVDISILNYMSMSREMIHYFSGYRIIVYDPGNRFNMQLVMSDLKIHLSKKEKYAGFSVDGNRRFLLGDMTVTHNSSTIGCLTNGELDDGRGLSRMGVVNYKHEFITGQTSSVAHHIMGFTDKGEQVTSMSSKPNHLTKSWADIIRKSSKIASFYDLCGHQKYLKTTITGLATAVPDVCLIMVGSNMGVNDMTKEHMFLCMSLKIPFVFVVTKLDICKDREKILKETMVGIKKLIKMPGIRRIPIVVESMEDVITCAKRIDTYAVVPIIRISNVTGMGLPFLKQFLNLVPIRNKNICLNKTKTELHIDSIFTITGTGTVVGGNLVAGTIDVGDKVVIGPSANGTFRDTVVKSIHRKRIPVQRVEAGTYVCVSLRHIPSETVRKGYVLTSPHVAYSVRQFTAHITISKGHSTTINIGYEPVVFINNLRETCKIIDILEKTCSRETFGSFGDKVLRSGDSALVSFIFPHRNVFIKRGETILFCQGKVKAVGVVHTLLRVNKMRSK